MTSRAGEAGWRKFQEYTNYSYLPLPLHSSYLSLLFSFSFSFSFSCLSLSLVYLFIYLPIYLPTCLSAYLSIYLPTYPVYIFHPSTDLSIHLSIFPPRSSYLSLNIAIYPVPFASFICLQQTESAAPATKSVPNFAKALRLPRNLYLTLRKCCLP